MQLRPRSTALRQVRTVALIALAFAASRGTSPEQVLAAEPAPAAPQVFATSLAELRATYAADAGKVRLLMILSPGCGHCRQGAAAVHSEVLGALAEERIAVYVVWSPILEGDDERLAAEAAAGLPDARARHFWNVDLEIARSAARRLEVDDQTEFAWDVFLVYDPTTVWKSDPRRTDAGSGDELPEHSAWMHGKFPNDPRYMTPAALLRTLRALLPLRPPTR